MKLLTVARIWPKYKGVYESREGPIRKLNKEKFRTIHIYISKRSDNPNQFEQSGQKVYYLLKGRGARMFNVLVLWRLIRILKKEDVNILHCHKHKSVVYAFLASFFVRPLVVIAHVHGINRTRNWRRRLLNRFVFKRVHKIFTVGQATAEDVLVSNSGLDKSLVYSLGNSITFKRYDRLPSEKGNARENLKLPEDAIVFGTVSRLTTVKGLDYLVEAFVKVKKNLDSAVLVIVGEGTVMPELKKQVLDAGIAKSVLFLGYRTDVPLILGTFDCFVIPSIGEEGLPRALIEAMAARIPVIGTRISGIPEILDDGKYGLLVPPRNSDALAVAMIDITQKPSSEIEQITQVARQRVLDEYSHENIAGKLEKIYTELAIAQGIICQYYLISYPKSGRTWLRLMIGKFFQIHYNLKIRKNKHLLRPDLLYRRSKEIPSLQVEHYPNSETTWKNDMEELQQLLNCYRGTKVIFLVRDPRDVVVSHYFQETRRPKKDPCKYFKGTLSEFVRNKYYGVDVILKFCNLWASRREVPEDFLLVRYEDLQKNTVAELNRVINFFGINNILTVEIEQAVQFAAFDNMQKLEKNGVMKSSMLRPADVNDLNSYKTRKGKVEGFYDDLTKVDIEFLNDRLSKKMDPFFGYEFSMDDGKIKDENMAGSADSVG